MSKTITIVGQKGGTGKSAAAVNLSASLALFEKQILMIDCDPQGWATQWSGVKPADHTGDLGRVLSGRAGMRDAVTRTRLRGMDVLAAGTDLYEASLKLARHDGNEKILRLFLDDIAGSYDYIIIDSPSSYHFLSTMAMVAADSLFFVVSAQESGYDDVSRLLFMIKQIRKRYDVPVTLGGLVFNRCPEKKQGLDFLETHDLSDISPMVCDTTIPEDRNVRRAADRMVPLALLNIKSPASQAYLALANEIDGDSIKRGVA